MKFTITKREVEGITIFDLVGRMSFPDPHIQPMFSAALKDGCKGFVINLAGLTYMDSYGLNDLVRVYNDTKAAGAKLILLKPNPNVKRTIEITMKTIFAFSDDESAAIQAVL
jgi:anti-anti-sigma factor